MAGVQDFTVLTNKQIAREVYEMTLAGDTGTITAPGQFVNIALPGFYLRRPISICDWEPGKLRLIYKVVGEGTAAMANFAPGIRLDLLLPLGNGFTVPEGVGAPLLVGGGVGVPPLYGLARRLCQKGLRPAVVMGFGGAGDVFYVREFEELGCRVKVSTLDGGVGTKGFVTDIPAMKDPGHDYFYACGPEAMLEAVYHAVQLPGQLSFEERMACGFGVCMGCSCKTKYGYKRICKDGPVLQKDEVIWEGKA